MKFRDAMIAAGRSYLYGVLAKTEGNVSEAARLAGVHRTTMYKLLPKYGVNVERVSAPGWTDPLCKYPAKG